MGSMKSFMILVLLHQSVHRVQAGTPTENVPRQLRGSMAAAPAATSSNNNSTAAPSSNGSNNNSTAAPSSNGSQCASEWSECGRDHPPCCGEGVCQMQNIWYSQCIPPTEAAAFASSSTEANNSLPGGGGVFAQGCCAFATSYMCADWRHEDVQRAYISDALAAERGFFAAPGVSYDPDTGLSQDGSRFDFFSGAVDAHHGLGFSAPSKEMIQISLLALSLATEDTGLVTYTREEALDLLTKKVQMFEDFDASFPAFGGYLPWFCSRGSKSTSDGKTACRTEQDPPGPLAPVSDWTDRLPSLDNGQLAWAAYSAANALSDLAAKENGEQQARIVDLARRWQKRVDRMKSTAVPLFYNGNGTGNIRIIAHLKNLSQDAANSPNNAFTVDNMVLNLPFEGELMVVWMTLFADWSGYPSNGAREKALIWADKRKHLFALNYTTKEGENITVQRGFWASAHEQWKLLVLPYLDIPLVKQVFANTERARLINSIDNDYPGLFASSHAPEDAHCLQDSDYCSDYGVGPMAQLPVQVNANKLSVTPYAAFPAILIDPGAGLAWYNTMLRLPQMQTTAGSVESSDLAGNQVAPFLTWDAKATTVLAMLGGTGPKTRKYLERDGLLQQFKSYVGDMYTSVFGGKKLTADSSDSWRRLDKVHEEALPLPSVTIGGEALDGTAHALAQESQGASGKRARLPLPPVITGNEVQWSPMKMSATPYVPVSQRRAPLDFATCKCYGGQVPPAVARSPVSGCSR
eukprot:TRINITY_DN5984_c0_g1_i1.p1 TRINITY_DN5984_c0_g1~~TRINITY_DN5984_c0_g1_i1.p1  ORF type:complete len:748 (+),score=132.91 TRINITY_DN5984_c0_g1_i1:81-2324(+)